MHSDACYQLQCSHLDDACVNDDDAISCSQDVHSDDCYQLQCSHLDDDCVYDEHQDNDSDDSSFSAAISASEGGERLRDASNDGACVHEEESNDITSSATVSARKGARGCTTQA
eukprot:6322385-Karenia_brevis.AAC.1